MKNLIQGNIFKNLILFAIPLMLSGLLSQSFGTINTMIIGKLLGEAGIAESGSTGTFVQATSSIIWGLGMGTSLHIASLFGSGQFQKMANAVKVNLILITALAFAISAGSVIFHKEIFAFLKIKEDIYHDSLVYFCVYMSGYCLFSINWTVVYMFSAWGNTSYPVKISLLTNVLNVIGNILFIAVFKTGIIGSALSCVIANAISAVLYLLKIHSEFKSAGVVSEKIYFNLREIKESLKLGIPCMFQQLSMYISSAGIQPMINNLGTAAIAGYSVCMRVYDINSCIFHNSSKGVSNFCAQSIGAGKVSLTKKGLRTGLLQAFMFALPAMLVCFLLPKQIVSLFYNDTTGESASYVIQYILVCVPFIVFPIVNNLFHNFFRGVMMAHIALITSISYSIVRIVATYILAPEYKMNGVFAALIIAWIFETLISIIIYVSNKWKTKAYLSMEEAEKNSPVRL